VTLLQARGADRLPTVGGPRPAPPTAARGLARPAGAAVAVLLAAGVASVLVGSRSLSPVELLDPSETVRAIYAARLERTFLAAAVGAALGLAGALMQGLTRNPLADPGILGVNAGASLAMVLAIAALGVSDLQGYVWFAFAGAALAALLVHGVAALGRDGATPVKLAVAGAAVTAAVTSWTSAVLLVDRSTMETFRFWAVGTVGGRGLEVLATGAPFLLVGAALALAGCRLLDALALGDDVARGLGRRTTLDRVLVGLAIVLLAGTATALAGPIGFVGLLVPHAVRAVVGPAHARLLPLSAVIGAVLVLVADTVGRILLPPAEVQVGIMTAVIGVPFFLALVRRGRMGAL
jgi:iron complex transport system permease protein